MRRYEENKGLLVWRVERTSLLGLRKVVSWCSLSVGREGSLRLDLEEGV